MTAEQHLARSSAVTDRGFIQRHGLVRYKHGLGARYRAKVSCEAGNCRAYGIEADTGHLVHDHCHAHGWVRGLVCVPCNNRLMHIRDRAEAGPAPLAVPGSTRSPELLSHIAPGHSENINFFGAINVDVEAELAKLVGGWRPLRPAQPADLGL